MVTIFTFYFSSIKSLDSMSEDEILEHLHSTLVLLKATNLLITSSNIINLHSTLVLLKVVTALKGAIASTIYILL